MFGPSRSGVIELEWTVRVLMRNRQATTTADMPIRTPTLNDFLQCACQEFHFLVVEFACQEQCEVNEFQVRYRNSTTLVAVEGIN